MPPRISVLILSRRRLDRLRICLRSVLAQDAADVEVVVLANGCEETADVVRSEFPAVRLAVSDVNLGTAGGKNRIADEARGEYLFYLDDDGELRSPDSLRRLAAELDARPRVAIVSMALLDADTDEPTGWRLTQGQLPYACYHASFAGGACMLRAAVFDGLGRYDPELAGPGEEFDLAVRLYAAGHAVLYFPGTVMHHHVVKTEADWRPLVSAGYSNLQFVIWRRYPLPWAVAASLKAFATQIYVDLRICGGRMLIADFVGAARAKWRGLRSRRAVSSAGLASLYAAKYYRLDDWEDLESARRGVLWRVPFLRVRRKLSGVPKLPPPARGQSVGARGRKTT